MVPPIEWNRYYIDLSLLWISEQCGHDRVCWWCDIGQSVGSSVGLVLGVSLQGSLWTLKSHNLGCGCNQYITLYHMCSWTLWGWDLTLHHLTPPYTGSQQDSLISGTQLLFWRKGYLLFICGRSWNWHLGCGLQMSSVARLTIHIPAECCQVGYSEPIKSPTPYWWPLLVATTGGQPSLGHWAM